MTVCRYYLKGNCRFGDRCRFEHVDNSNNYSRGSDYGYQDRYRPQQYSDPNLSYGPRRDIHQERYNQPPRYNYSERYDYNEQNYSSGRNQHDPRYYASEENLYASAPRYTSDINYYKNKYGKQRHEWVSDEYKKQLESKSQKNQAGTFFNTSTPKSKVSFSFKDPDFSSIKNPPADPQSKVSFSFKDPGFSSIKNPPADLHMNERNLLLANIIKEDVTNSVMGKQWPFSCYFPVEDKSGFPGFVDLLPEELRYEAYKAKENSTYDSYVESEKKAVLEIKNKRAELLEPSVKLMSIIDKICKGEDFSSEYIIDSGTYFSKFSDTALEDMIAEQHTLPLKNTASSFSFKTAIDTDTIKTSASNFSFKDIGSAVQKSASSFSFKLPSETDSKQPVHDVDSHFYTPLDKLSLQDKEQFLASTFTLGKIPTVPPPESLCF